MDYGGWYDLESKEFKFMQDLVFLSTLGRNDLNQRFIRHFQVINGSQTDEDAMRIF